MDFLAPLYLAALIINGAYIVAFVYFCIFYYVECIKINAYTGAIVILSIAYSFSYTMCISTAAILLGITYVWIESDETEIQAVLNSVKMWTIRIFLCIKHFRAVCRAFMSKFYGSSTHKVRTLDDMKDDLAESNNLIDAVLKEN